MRSLGDILGCKTEEMMISSFDLPLSSFSRPNKFWVIWVGRYNICHKDGDCLWSKLLCLAYLLTSYPFLLSHFCWLRYRRSSDVIYSGVGWVMRCSMIWWMENVSSVLKKRGLGTGI